MAKLRVVVKIGSSSLTNENGGLSRDKLKEHVEAIAELRLLGHEVILISSGAVAAGYMNIGYPSRPVTIAGKQAAAAVGQGLLMQGYTEECKKYNMVAAQLLLTRSSFEQKDQYQNAYAVLTELLKRGTLPIINENDSVSVEELTFGDNDMLSALVSGLIHADELILLTDVNGIYDKNPKNDPDAKKYDYIDTITEEIMDQASSSGTKVGTGGMKSKIMAAKTATSLGVKVFIGTGVGKDKLKNIIEGTGDGTYIGGSNPNIVRSAKQWIGLHSQVSGTIEIDAGAVDAICNNGKSLLPAGIKNITGTFFAGDVVEVLNEKKEVIGKGQVNYDSNELEQIKGKSSKDAMDIVNRSIAVVIHRDNWVRIGDKSNSFIH